MMKTKLFAFLCRAANYRKQFAYLYAALWSISIARAEYISSYNIFGKACFSKGRSPADNRVIRKNVSTAFAQGSQKVQLIAPSLPP